MIRKEYNVAFDDGVFKDLFLKFVAYKQGHGYKYDRVVQSSLSVLNTKLNAYKLNTPILSKEIVEALASRREHEAPATQIKRVCYLRHFAEFLREMGHEAYVYPKHCDVIFHDGFVPYIFTKRQINSIIEAADSLAFRLISPKQHLVWPAFIRLLYGCGLRLSEALDLKAQNVNLESGILYIEKSKNGTSRYVPLSGSLKDHLSKYVIDMKIDLTKEGYFFPAPDDGRYAINTAYERIKKLYEKAGIPRLSNGRYPRVHDVRHTYSCHALKQMQEDGHDIYYALPILSTYLGHQGIRDTERYLRLPMFQISDIIEAELAVLNGIVPEVSEYEET